MNRKASRGSTPRGGSRGGPARSGKRPLQQGKKTPGVAKKRAAAGAAPAAPIELPPITLGFVRGVAPSKWAERWARSVREQPLELAPVDLHEVEAARTEVDVLLERVAPGQIPHGSDESRRTRHAMRLYEETIALVVPAPGASVDVADLHAAEPDFSAFPVTTDDRPLFAYYGPRQPRGIPTATRHHHPRSVPCLAPTSPARRRPVAPLCCMSTATRWCSTSRRARRCSASAPR